jgi:hypothetical protein
VQLDLLFYVVTVCSLFVEVIWKKQPQQQLKVLVEHCFYGSGLFGGCLLVVACSTSWVAKLVFSFCSCADPSLICVSVFSFCVGVAVLGLPQECLREKLLSAAALLFNACLGVG